MRAAQNAKNDRVQKPGDRLARPFWQRKAQG
jgi:hypothetical protein